MVLDGNMLGARSELGAISNFDAALVIFSDLAAEFGFGCLKIKDNQNLIQEIKE